MTKASKLLQKKYLKVKYTLLKLKKETFDESIIRI